MPNTLLGHLQDEGTQGLGASVAALRPGRPLALSCPPTSPPRRSAGLVCMVIPSHLHNLRVLCASEELPGQRLPKLAGWRVWHMVMDTGTRGVSCIRVRWTDLGATGSVHTLLPVRPPAGGSWQAPMCCLSPSHAARNAPVFSGVFSGLHPARALLGGRAPGVLVQGPGASSRGGR